MLVLSESKKIVKYEEELGQKTSRATFSGDWKERLPDNANGYVISKCT